MIRFACPSCKSISTQPDSEGGRGFTCPECGQKLLVPALPETPPFDPMNAAPPLPAALPSSFTTEPRHAPATPPPPPLPQRLHRPHDDEYDDDFEDDIPAIRQRRHGYYPLEV